MQYLMEEWKQVEVELMRERGLWGPPVGSDLDKWMLDVTEGISCFINSYSHSIFCQLFRCIIVFKHFIL